MKTYDDFFYLGKITKLHGYKGAMVLFLDVDDPTPYYGLDGVFIEMNDQLIPYFIQRADPRGHQLIVEFEGVNGEADAMALVNKSVHLPMTLLPKLSGKQFYFHEVIGFTVEDKNFGPVGMIRSITDHPMNPLFVIDHKGKDVLMPMNDDVLIEVDREKGRIVTNAPAGLIEMYIGTEK